MNRLLKNLVERAAKRAGVAVIPEWRLGNFPLARHLSRLFQERGIDCVFDVGANRGQYGLFLRREVGFAGTILSFEPIRKNVEALKRASSGDAHWFVHDYALGAKNGASPINVMNMAEFSSFHTPSAGQPFGDMNAVSYTEMVDIKTLSGEFSALRSRHAFRSPYLKMDTQGFDMRVVEGAGDVLGEVRALQTEISIQPIYDGMPDYRTAIKTLEDSGFAISNLFLVSSREMKAIEFDCVMVRA
jgi:FkbM family methyltransferase